jgi:hypothetical protein
MMDSQWCQWALHQWLKLVRCTAALPISLPVLLSFIIILTITVNITITIIIIIITIIIIIIMVTH